MKILETPLKDLVIIEPNVYKDDRGYFMESYKHSALESYSGDFHIIQENESFSKKGALRGLHYQAPPFAQAKLVRCIQGTVLDVCVDIRKGSPTYMKSFSAILSEDNKHQLFVPKGFAHGFITLSDTALFSYKVDAPYSPSSEGGIRWNDPMLNIDWKLSKDEFIISEKDGVLPLVNDWMSPFE
ncbi:dTDP-4-dehydrorhamnose 3,5-epimerase [Halosquirtibacter xylanolyticus]|uniref:dTDP-4-dehydrorhamnose 3,5-epimerase n=1 Tax=Halosquirtibacter xylanolyticus TaxID=3374599 RepID=UPI003748670D|nr:dTDP-4-dehydrorhamnose 3,5-epimerase [Prolixibacteraceae bacterium]